MNGEIVMARRTKVLIVDDDPMIIDLVTEILSDDFELESAGSVTEAHAKLDHFFPNIVLTDYSMPAGNGIDLLNRIKKFDQEIYVLLMTGVGNKIVAVDAIKGGACDFIEKPFNQDDLLRGVKKAAAKINLQRMYNDVRDRSMQNEKLAAMGAMAGNIAHELNNPMSVIQGRCEQIEMILDAGTPDMSKVKEALRNIDETCDRIGKIIGGLKKLSRSTRKEDHFTHTSLKEIIEDTYFLCKERFRNHNIDLYRESVPNDIIIECHCSQLCQVLVNFLNNAFDAIVDAEEPWVKVGFEDLGETFRIMVIDSGKIPQEIADRIMDPFYTTKPVGKGTGLGLSISCDIARNHNGKLYLDREHPHTCFVLELPKSQVKISDDPELKTAV